MTYKDAYIAGLCKAAFDLHIPVTKLLQTATQLYEKNKKIEEVAADKLDPNAVTNAQTATNIDNVERTFQFPTNT